MMNRDQGDPENTKRLRSRQHRDTINSYSAEPLNRCRDKAFEDLCRIGIPDRMVERYKYSDIPELFKPDYGVNIKRLDVPVDPYKAFKCDVPNLSTSLYFIVNDCFYDKVTSRVNLPEGVTVGSLKQYAETNPDIVGRYYSQLADTSEDGVTAINTMRITVSVDFHVDTIIGTTIVLFQTIALAHWRHEICPRNHRKQSDTIHVWQNLLEIELHNFYIFYFRVAKVRKINRTKKCG